MAAFPPANGAWRSI